MEKLTNHLGKFRCPKLDEHELELVNNLFFNDIVPDSKDPKIIGMIGMYHYINKKNVENAKKFLMSAVEQNDNISMCNLGCMYYSEFRDKETGIYYYEMASKAGNINAINRLSIIYGDRGDYENMKKYCMIGIESGNASSMNNYAWYCQYGLKNYTDMVKYYLKAIELGCSLAMINYAHYLCETRDITNAKKYYLMGLKNGGYVIENKLVRIVNCLDDSDELIITNTHVISEIKPMDYLFADYSKLRHLGKYCDNEKSNELAFRIGSYYRDKKDFINMKKYYLMVLKNGFNLPITMFEQLLEHLECDDVVHITNSWLLRDIKLNSDKLYNVKTYGLIKQYLDEKKIKNKVNSLLGALCEMPLVGSVETGTCEKCHENKIISNYSCDCKNDHVYCYKCFTQIRQCEICKYPY